ncbi:RNA polymerase II-associated protein 2 [Elysia marginata]|uniref:RNA polymerase II subunit B1 CTD phosphatase RPAP2 homolog n=1 Tax=Elysia marginata TaxID=1093978 RepID=A0AAV4JH44_9GAST|nr:RNA polymerase II-associated protein 2 [Elysia marginata]
MSNFVTVCGPALSVELKLIDSASDVTRLVIEIGTFLTDALMGPVQSTPNKKYHVSTKTNKVYEISERKNFCSNQCFKASRHFLAQIPDSPLWMRDKEQLPTINLLEHDSINFKDLRINRFVVNFSLPDVLMPLNLCIQDVSGPMRELVQTCRLEKDNIVLRPGEWTLATLLILKMLASRYPLIQSAFTSDLAVRHFSAVLSRLGHDFTDVQTNVQDILDVSKTL